MFILWDILSQRKKKLKLTHPQPMVAVATFDIFNSVGWTFPALPIPRYYDEYGDSASIYGARGNASTCTAQGLFIQLGYTGIFYNLSLSLYYTLSIVYSWKESKLKHIQKWLHIVPLTIGFVLAFAGIPYYTNDILACYIAPPPLIFGMLPIATVIVITTLTMAFVYLKVHKSMGKSRVGERVRKNDLEKQVFRQSVFYLCSFWISWPILLLSNGLADKGVYPLFLISVALTPIQGFNNFLVYIRPRMLRRKASSPQAGDSGPLREFVVRQRKRLSSFFSLGFLRHPSSGGEAFMEPENQMAQDLDGNHSTSTLEERVPSGCSPRRASLILLQEIRLSVASEEGRSTGVAEPSRSRRSSMITLGDRGEESKSPKGAYPDEFQEVGSGLASEE